MEQKTAAPAAPASQLADVDEPAGQTGEEAALRLRSASQFADFATRLDKLEKKAAVPATPSPEAAESSARLDKGEKSAVVPRRKSGHAASARDAETIDAFGQSGASRPDRDEPGRTAASLCSETYSVEDVRFGIALVGTRHGSQQVAPGDMIPGAGRVLRIERQGGDWVVVTTLGVIAGGPAPR